MVKHSKHTHTFNQILQFIGQQIPYFQVFGVLNVSLSLTWPNWFNMPMVWQHWASRELRCTCHLCSIALSFTMNRTYRINQVTWTVLTHNNVAALLTLLGTLFIGCALAFGDHNHCSLTYILLVTKQRSHFSVATLFLLHMFFCHWSLWQPLEPYGHFLFYLAHIKDRPLFIYTKFHVSHQRDRTSVV